MNRCIQLALLGAGKVAPNPMVGSVLVHQNHIIGEGYHQQYGYAHAEVNCIQSVKENDKPLIPQSTLYVSLEPCNHQGKTPPCTGLIIQQRIPQVVIGCKDPFSKVAGKGIAALKAAGIEVIENVLETECRNLNRRFFTFHEQQRPYIILKWAQSSNGKIAADSSERTYISNGYTNRLVHRWRSEETAILVGTNTAFLDNPSLTNRLWTGKQPVRLVLDLQLKLPPSLQLFDDNAHTVVFNYHRHSADFNINEYQQGAGKTFYYQIDPVQPTVKAIIHALVKLNIQSLLVEGGTQLLQSFIDARYWDEARVITNKNLLIENGKNAPVMDTAMVETNTQLEDNSITIYKPSLKNTI